MRKALLVVLVVLLVFCVIGIGIASFFGYRHFQSKRAEIEDALIEEPQPMPEEDLAWLDDDASDGASPEPPAPSGEQAGDAASPPAQPPPGAESPARPSTSQPKPPPARSSSSPPPPTSSRPSGSSTAPSTASEASPPTIPADPATAPPKKKKPKGVLSVIFESTVPQGEVTIFVDNQPIARQPFTASKKERFRLPKAKRFLPGNHRVRVEVVGPGGKKVEREWNAMVVVDGNTIWKVEVKNFRRKPEVKPIQP